MAGSEFADTAGGVQRGNRCDCQAIQWPFVRTACAKEDSSLLLILSCHSIKGLLNRCKLQMQKVLLFYFLTDFCLIWPNNDRIVVHGRNRLMCHIRKFG
jgi:hypothetical protein